jgi:hypothetical protein
MSEAGEQNNTETPAPEQTASEQTTSEQTTSEQPASEQNASGQEQTTSEQTTSEQEQNAQTSTEETSTNAEEQSSVEQLSSPDDYQVPDFVTPEMKKQAFENGLSNDQFNFVIQQYGQITQIAERERQAQLENMAKAQIEKWGDGADVQLNYARRALDIVDPTQELKKMLVQTGYDKHPTVLRFLARLGEQLREGGFMRGKISRPPGKKSRAELLYGDKHPVTN